MPTPLVPSPEQLGVLQKLLTSPRHRIVRLPGGFWTTPDDPMGGRVLALGRFDNGGSTPSWHTGTQTVRAMERRGWLQRTNTYAEEWRDDRELTEAGRAAGGAC
jgi:hypothetical protein